MRGGGGVVRGGGGVVRGGGGVVRGWSRDQTYTLHDT